MWLKKDIQTPGFKIVNMVNTQVFIHPVVCFQFLINIM